MSLQGVKAAAVKECWKYLFLFSGAVPVTTLTNGEGLYVGYLQDRWAGGDWKKIFWEVRDWLTWERWKKITENN